MSDSPEDRVAEAVGVALISAMDDGIGPYVEFTDAWRDLSGEEQASKAAGWVRAALAAFAELDIGAEQRKVNRYLEAHLTARECKLVVSGFEKTRNMEELTNAEDMALVRLDRLAGEPSELASEGGAHKSSPGNLPVGEVEAVAKAILDSARQENPDIPIHWTFYEDEARAAIAALDASRQRDPQELDPHSANWRDGFLTAKAEAQRDPAQLLALAEQAMMDALSWMDPKTAKKFMAESSYQEFAAGLRALGGVDG